MNNRISNTRNSIQSNEQLWLTTIEVCLWLHWLNSAVDSVDYSERAIDEKPKW